MMPTSGGIRNYGNVSRVGTRYLGRKYEADGWELFLWTAGRVLLLGHVVVVVIMDSLRNL